MKCKHFVIQELVDRKTYELRGEAAWELLDNRLLEMIDKLREKFGKMTINNWHWNGNREWSGLRTPDSKYYSKYSQHSYGRAVDMIPAEIGVNEIRTYIKANPDEFPYIKGLEEDVTWLHIDCRNCDTLKSFKP